MSQHPAQNRRRWFGQLRAPLLVMTGLVAGGCAVSRIPDRAASRGGVPEPSRRPVAEHPPRDPLQALVDAQVSIVGEVHDNQAQHALRIGWLRQLIARKRFALAMEQFDVDRQPAIDQARRQRLDALALARAAGFNFDGWDWRFYEPCVALALANDLPLLAANLPGRAAMAAAPVDAPGWSAADQQQLVDQIGQSHCGALPARALVPMATAQKARDRMMAQVMAQALQRFNLPVVLLAGNGHARRDLGVPRYLPEWLPAVNLLTIGLLEQADGDDEAAGARYDLVVSTPTQARIDPCIAFLDAMKTSRPPAGR